MRRKDKSEVQQEAKIKREKEAKNVRLLRRQSPALERDVEVKPTHKNILIVCEGKNTEPTYFNQFKLSFATVTALGNGFNTVSLVKQAAQLKDRGKKPYDKIWVVFDKDDFPNKDFDDAIKLAEQHEFGVAYSNQAFEYWLILHFDDHQGGGMNRTLYEATINKHLKKFSLEYEGSDSKIITTEMFDIFMSLDPKTGKRRVDKAIERAERNYNLLDHNKPSLEESSTSVFRLVKELLEYS